jgi:hypothetical protein
MVYAVEIINNVFDRTKKLFFPIRIRYWLRMGFISMFSLNNGSGNSNSSSRGDELSKFFGNSFRESMTEFNSSALNWLSQYGFITSIIFFILFLISLVFSFIGSVFTFIFIEGIIKKDVKIIKGFKNNTKLGSCPESHKYVY